MSVSMPEEETTAPKTVAELTANRPQGPVWDDTYGAGGQDLSAYNLYINSLSYAASQEGWTDVLAYRGADPNQPLPQFNYGYTTAGAQPIATKPNPNNSGTYYTLYEDGTIREDSYEKSKYWNQVVAMGYSFDREGNVIDKNGRIIRDANNGFPTDKFGNIIGFGSGGAGGFGAFGGAGGFEGAAAQFAMGGGGSPAGRAARDAAILLARQYGFDASFFSQIENLLYEGISEDSLTLALRQTDAYKKRFAGNEARVKKGLPALSEAEYINMENLYRQELRAAGLPPAFYDDLNDFRTYIENDISYNEFVSRVGLAKRASISANPEVKKQLKDLYGVGDSDLVGYFLNPEKTTSLLQRQFNVAQTAGALSKSGFGTAMAEELTTSVLGGSSETLNYGELEKAAQTAAVFRPLSTQVLGGEKGAVSEADLLRGVVAEDVKSARELQKEQQRRLAEYQGGGSLAQAQQGIVGLRSAAR